MMEAFAIKSPKGYFAHVEVDSNEDECWECFCDESSLNKEWWVGKGYRCVPVQVIEIEPKEPK